MKEKLLLIGYRAFGDWLFTVPVLPYLFDKYEVHLETNMKGWMLLHDDPRFASKRMFPFENLAEDRNMAIFKRWFDVECELKPDKVINLWRTLETECITESYMADFFMDTEYRQKHYGGKVFIEAIFNKCEIPIPEDMKLDCVYYHPHELEWGERWKESNKGHFVIAIPVCGSSSHKIIPAMREWTLKILEDYPAALIYLMVDKAYEDYLWKHERIRHIHVDQRPLKQNILMMKHVDMAIGPDTGLMVAAGMWGTPKIQLATASSVYQMAKYHKNDYSIQSQSECSPCQRAVYGVNDCERMRKVGTENGEDWYYPECIYRWDEEHIFKTVEKIYNERFLYNKAYAEKYIKLGKSDLGHEIYKKRWELIEKYCRGSMTLLDYGCASGAFINASGNGFRTNGFDINPYYGFKGIPKSNPDILTMWDVIEHIPEPKKVIKKLKPEWMFICTPNSGEVKDMQSWKHYRPGEHLHYFNPDSVSKLLGECGYKVIESNYDEAILRDKERPHDILTVVAKRV